MIESIVDCLEPVTLIGGGQATPEDLEIALTLAPTCIAADSGAHFAREAGVSLAAVIGDFDSVSPDVLAGIAAHRQHRIAEQDSTDFEKALTRITAPVVVGVGFTGGRVDHQLAAFHTLAAYPARRCVLLGPSEIVLLSPPRLALPTQAGDVISLFPLGPVQGAARVWSGPLTGWRLIRCVRSARPIGRRALARLPCRPRTC
ncbi:thiamine diphosphokinase [Sulfitobacter aestuariivivens]|uniref:thiamine diphosphokinase n=1 Tax=Sulfitobacter aestuariivivens TaxID=2766981 RepID=UPI00360A57B8